MELPQPRPFETDGRKPSRDFLSLCSHSTAHPDPRTPPQGGYLKTHDFLRPLERVGIRGGAKEETSSVDTSASKDPQPPSSVDQRVLPGGIGTYTISHIPYVHQRIPKPEDSPMFTLAQASGCERNTDENSNCSSHAASGFTLWDESAGKKGGKKKENVEERASLRVDAATTMGQWPGTDHRNSFSSGSSSQASGLKSQSFMDMMWSAKVNSQDDDEEELVMKTESPSTSQKVDLRVKADGDQKPNTPRSKHSATEQRRRSKINDRFQMLRQLIPNSDQKRDKASFLLEVVEYIQFLQEKVNKHEGSYYQGWNPEPGKLMNWRNSQRLPPEGSVAFAPKLEEKNNIPMPQTVISNAKGGNAMDPQCRAGKPFPVLTGSPISQFPTRNVSEHRRNQTQPCSGVPSEGEGVIESGSINIASVYSQGLMKKLTQALESSGVDLTKASISVQIDLPTHSSLKDEEVRRTRPRTETDDDDDGGHKKLKTDIN